VTVSVRRPGQAGHDVPEAVRLPDGSEAVRLPDGASTADLLAALGVDARRYVTVVNGVACPRPVPLREGDRVQLHVNQAGG